MSKMRLWVSCRGVILTGGMVVSVGVGVVGFFSCCGLFAHYVDLQCYPVAY